MKWICAVAMAVVFMAGGEAFADGNNGNSSCASSALICKSLDALNVDSDQTVVHPCTMFGGDPGAWVCPDADHLRNPSDQQSLAPSSGENYRDMNGQ